MERKSIPSADYIKKYKKSFDKHDQRLPYKLIYTNTAESGCRRFATREEAEEVFKATAGTKMLVDCVNKKTIAYFCRNRI